MIMNKLYKTISLIGLGAWFFCIGVGTLNAQIAMKTHYVYVINNSTAEINVMVERTINSMNWGPDSSYAESYFCFGPECYAPVTNESPYEPIAFCSSDQTFIAYYKMKDSIAINDTSSITYCFKEQSNPGVEQCVTFLTSLNSPSSVHEDTIVFSSAFGCPPVFVADINNNDPSISIYPNPAREWITVKYSLKDNSNDAWFVLRNMLGATALKINLSGTSGIIKMPAADLNPGIYFYSLIVDNVVASTNKLVIDN
jgi:hypothetical protein